MVSELRSLFSPIKVGRLTLKNRICSSGHAEAMAEGGRPGERLRRYHEAKARGGCALTIFGGSSSVHPSSPAAAWKQIANHDDSIIPAYRAIADAVHDHGCLVFTQITHLGRRAQADGEETNVLLAPSQIPERVHRDVPHELEAEQIAELVRAFGAAARPCPKDDSNVTDLGQFGLATCTRNMSHDSLPRRSTQIRFGTRRQTGLVLRVCGLGRRRDGGARTRRGYARTGTPRQDPRPHGLGIPAE